MEKNLYRDEINNVLEPTYIEKDLSKLEKEAADILKRFLNGNTVVISKSEDEKLKLFFAIMGFRSKKSKDLFVENLKKDSKKLYSVYQKNKNFEDFWKRNLGYLVNCRSIDEVINHPEIDKPIKIFMLRDTHGILDMHFSILDKSDFDEFIIGDNYPETIACIHQTGIPYHLYSIYPISSNRVLLAVSSGAYYAPRNIIELRECSLYPPKVDENNNEIFHVKKLFKEEVEYINFLILKDANEGVASKTKIK